MEAWESEGSSQSSKDDVEFACEFADEADAQQGKMQIRDFIVYGLAALLVLMLIGLIVGLFRYTKSKTKKGSGRR